MRVQAPPGCYNFTDWSLILLGLEVAASGPFLLPSFPCSWYPRRAHWNEAAVEFNKDIVKVGQQWERADGRTVTVQKKGDSLVLIDSIWYNYNDGGMSNIHEIYPKTRLIRLLLDLDKTTEAPLDEDEDNAISAEQETEAQEQHTEVQGQDVTVFSRFSNSVHNYPQLGYAVVHINGLQIEVDFDGRELKIQDNSDRHEPLFDL